MYLTNIFRDVLTYKASLAKYAIQNTLNSSLIFGKSFFLLGIAQSITLDCSILACCCWRGSRKAEGRRATRAAQLSPRCRLTPPLSAPPRLASLLLIERDTSADFRRNELALNRTIKQRAAGVATPDKALNSFQ